MNITEVEGIGPEYRQRLADAGIYTTDELLERGATPRGRTGIEAATGISGKLILEWVNHADLMRIDGVGSEYADLLEAAGVDSPAELAHRNAANLATTFQEIDAARPNWIRRVPSETTVTGWIEQAKAMDKAVSHGGGTPGPTPAGSAAPVAAAASAPAATHGHEHAHEHDPAPAASAAPAPKPAAPAGKPVAAAAPAKSAAPETPGLWARIKGMFGGG
jgi:predicted flap endonuclease-1-like 5' DNA nuclease